MLSVQALWQDIRIRTCISCCLWQGNRIRTCISPRSIFPCLYSKQILRNSCYCVGMPYSAALQVSTHSVHGPCLRWPCLRWPCLRWAYLRCHVWGGDVLCGHVWGGHIWGSHVLCGHVWGGKSAVDTSEVSMSLVDMYDVTMSEVAISLVDMSELAMFLVDMSEAETDDKTEWPLLAV